MSEIATWSMSIEEVQQLIDEHQQQKVYINKLHKLLNANGIGIGTNLLTGEVIPFEEFL